MSSTKFVISSWGRCTITMSKFTKGLGSSLNSYNSIDDLLKRGSRLQLKKTVNNDPNVSFLHFFLYGGIIETVFLLSGSSLHSVFAFIWMFTSKVKKLQTHEFTHVTLSSLFQFASLARKGLGLLESMILCTHRILELSKISYSFLAPISMSSCYMSSRKVFSKLIVAHIYVG